MGIESGDENVRCFLVTYSKSTTYMSKTIQIGLLASINPLQIYK